MQVQELVAIVPWNFVATICNLFIQMYLIKRFLFKPINKVLEQRRAMADSELQEAREAKKSALAMQEEYEQNIARAKDQAGEIIREARRTADSQSEKLLQEGDYTRAKKRRQPLQDIVGTIYWLAVTAAYLGWSFYTFQWHRTWIIWPVAGVLYALIANAVEFFAKDK